VSLGKTKKCVSNPPSDLVGEDRAKRRRARLAPDRPVLHFFQLRRKQPGLDPPAPQQIEAAMARHAQEPAVKWERRVVPLDDLGQTREDVASGILGSLRGAEEMAAETQHARAERLVELGEALLIAAPGALHGPRHFGSAHGPLTSNTLG